MRPIEPIDEIRFAVKTGFLTKAMWHEFFAEGGECWRRRNWNLLSSRGFFKPHTSKRATEVLVLNPKNKLVKETVGDDICRPPYVAQLDHDEIIARSILRLCRAGVVAAFQVETELKRWAPKSHWRQALENRDKFPDALIHFRNGLRVAIELELTLKSRRRYRHILRTYRSYNSCDQIIYIVNSESIFTSITESMDEIRYVDESRPIAFMWLDEWVADPMTARIVFRTKATTIPQMISIPEKV